MDDNKEKEITTMPTNLKRGLGKYINKDEGIAINTKIVIIILIFSLILILIGTIIIINSYNPVPKVKTSEHILLLSR